MKKTEVNTDMAKLYPTPHINATPEDFGKTVFAKSSGVALI